MDSGRRRLHHSWTKKGEEKNLWCLFAEKRMHDCKRIAGLIVAGVGVDLWEIAGVGSC